MIIGYTSGVFDLFHVGHLKLLQKAKENCDYLIVGVCSDKLSKKLKGKKPIINENQRIEIVEALRCVDQVYLKTIDMDVNFALKYDAKIIFKGNDWQNTSKWIYNETFAKKLGISVVFLPYTKRISSTKIRGKLNG